MAAVAGQRPFRKWRADTARAAPLTDIARNGRKTPVSARTWLSPRASFVPWLTQNSREALRICLLDPLPAGSCCARFHACKRGLVAAG